MSIQPSFSDSAIMKHVLTIFQPLDDILKCHICFDYYKNCVTTKCSHNYCSLCIRRYMMHKSQCPECFQEAVEPDLRNNRLIDEVLLVFNDIRNFLAADCGPAKQKLNSTVSLEDMPTDDRSQSKLKTLSDECQTEKEKSTDIDISVDEVAVATTSRAVSSITDEVCCPLCSKSVSSQEINDHLDVCLISKSKVQKRLNKTRRLLPKVVYHLLTDREIKKRLRDNGLSTTGDRQSLINRHKNFVVLYNAECDSLHPRAVHEIIKQVEKEESAIAENSQTSKLFQNSKKSEPSKIAEENEKYLKKNQNHFNALIDQIMIRNSSNRGQHKSEQVNEEAGKNSPELFVTSDSENENSSPCDTFRSGTDVDTSKNLKPTQNFNSCFSICSSSDNLTICSSMKVKRKKRNIEESELPT